MESKSNKKVTPGPGPLQEDHDHSHIVGPDPWGNQFEDDTTDEDDNATWINLKRILKQIPRDNPNDPFKPYSVQAIQFLSLEEGKGKEEVLTKQEEALLQNYAADLDLVTPYHKTQPPAVNTDQISKESKAELAKLPPWLRTFIESKYGPIHDHYKNKTHIVLQMLANRLQYRKLKRWKLLPHDEDEGGIQRRRDDEVYGEIEETFDHDKWHVKHAEYKEVDPFHKPDVLQVAPEDKNLDLWSPILMQRAADALRAVILAGASDSEGDDPEGEWEDETQKLEEMRNKRKSFTLQDEGETIYKGPHWEDVVARKQHFAEKARWETDLEFTPDKKRKCFFFKTCRRYQNNEKNEKAKVDKGQNHNDKKTSKKRATNRRSTRMSKRNENKEQDKLEDDHDHDHSSESFDGHSHSDGEWEEELGDPDAGFSFPGFYKTSRLKRKYFSTDRGHPLYANPKNQGQRRARQFRERGVGKRASRIYIKDPCKGPVAHVTRELHQIRPTEGIHAYVNFITNSAGFSYSILLVILFNAVLLAAETGERTNKSNYQLVYDVFDNIFLSVYLVEFMLKLYSNPLQYFRSGFNIFDFIIVITSLIKAGLEWTGHATQYRSWLRYFIIIRAMRVLRGASFSVHTQVLVTALVETLKNHVLSVIILLVLLMYIASIVAFYLFSPDQNLNDTWGEVPKGMLRLFAFVTMDGWTEIMEEFSDANRPHTGRFFCLICIIFGNFVISNIFIAIIIMQISEATDTFRKKQADERESSVFLKQEAVFRRQRLDMRQLLARHKLGLSDDFYELGSRFVRRLQHDDLVDTRDIIFSPLWIDSFYMGMLRAHHTSNILMNIHRKMSDRLLKLNNLYNEGKSTTRGISRGRYNRYLDVKARLALLKQQFIQLRDLPTRKPLKVKLPNLISTEDHAKPPPRPPPMPRRSLWKEKKNQQ